MYLLLGYGKSNRSIEKYFIKNNIKYIVYDDIHNKCIINIKNIDIIIKSNGISNDHYIIKKAKDINIKIISDLQFFYNISNIINYCMVTGSNGKTTVVSLLEKCLKNTKAIGNNCLPFFDYIYDNQYKVLEVSSFMLENCNYIRYKYNIITNIYPTHLEHHKTYLNYIKSKLSFLKWLKYDDYVIYNYDDIVLRKIISSYDFKKIPISLYNKNCDIYLEDDYIYYINKKIINVSKLKLYGKHNIYNVMLCLGVILNNNLKLYDFKNKIYKFKSLKYRLELVYDKEIKILNDSKSTNFKALSVALDSIDNNIILIVGGKIRKDNYNLLNKYLYKINKVYCYGENRDLFYEFFINNNIESYKYETLNNAICNLNICNDDKYILFSPGSVSYDQFDNYEHRGLVFNNLVKDKFFFK